MEVLRAVLGPSWVPVEARRGPLRPSWAPLGRLGRLLELSWGCLGQPEGSFGPSWAPEGPSLYLRGRLGPLAGPSWAVLGASWTVLGPSWAVFLFFPSIATELYTNRTPNADEALFQSSPRKDDQEEERKEGRDGTKTAMHRPPLPMHPPPLPPQIREHCAAN